jgi:uncharacterized protein YcaQ
MIHHRKGFDRYYDLRERIIPPAVEHIASEHEARAFFGRKAIAFMGLLREKRWANELSGYLAHKLSPEQAQAELTGMKEKNQVTSLSVEGSKENWLVLSSDNHLLERLESGQVPVEWAPLGATSAEEVVFLAPLEIVSARGRARQLFDFDYIWEVYKPVEKRRWGYYTLPILFGDRLVARIDPKLERVSGILQVKGLWFEEESSAGDPAFVDALGRGLVRFAAFVRARQVDLSAVQPARLRAHLQQFFV